MTSEDTSTFGGSSDSDVTPDTLGQPATPRQRIFSVPAKRTSRSSSSGRRRPSSPIKEPRKITPPNASSALHPLQHPHSQRPVHSSVFSQHYLLHFWPFPIHAFIDIRRLMEHLLIYGVVCYALLKFVVNQNVVHEPWLVKGMNVQFVKPNPDLMIPSQNWGPSQRSQPYTCLPLERGPSRFLSQVTSASTQCLSPFVVKKLEKRGLSCG